MKRGFTVASQQWQNKAERFVGFLKDRGQHMSARYNVDVKYHHYLLNYICYVYNFTTHPDPTW